VFIEVKKPIPYNYLCKQEKENMSRLIEQFQKASRTAAAPMGFRTARPTELPPKIQLIATIEAGTAESPPDYLRPVDAVLIRFTQTNYSAKSLDKATSGLGDIPWGLYADDNEKAAEAGGDFTVFSTASRIDRDTKDGKAGKLLEADPSMDDGLLRDINDLPVDAVIIPGEPDKKGPLIWHQMMIYQHLANMFTKPLIIYVPADINEKELKILWDAGVDGIIVEADAGKAETLKDLRQTINKLPARAGRKKGKVEARLPRIETEQARTTAPPDEEEEEEDE